MPYGLKPPHGADMGFMAMDHAAAWVCAVGQSAENRSIGKQDPTAAWVCAVGAIFSQNDDLSQRCGGQEKAPESSGRKGFAYLMTAHGHGCRSDAYYAPYFMHYPICLCVIDG